MSAMIVIPAPKIPCFRCKKSHDTPAAFLIACAKCERAWHHTCHIPRVTENEIQDRISADKTGKREAGLGSWQCRTCTKRSRVEPSIASAAQPSDPVTRAPVLSQPTRAAHAHVESSQDGIKKQPKAAPIVISISDDDDDIVMLDEPPQQFKQSAAVPVKVSGPAAPLPQTRPVCDADSKAKASTVLVGGGSSIERVGVSNNLPYNTDPQCPTDQVDQPAPVELPVNKKPTPKGKERAFAPISSPLAHGSLPTNAPSQITDKEVNPDLPILAKRAKARNRLVVSPVHATQQDARGDPGPSSQLTFPLPAPLPVPAHPPSPKPGPPLPVPARTEFDTRPSSPHLSSGVASSAAIRALIANMREQGRLAPPPTIEWVQIRGTDAARKKHSKRHVSTPHNAVAAVSTTSDFAIGEELRTSTHAEESMEMDAQLSAPEPVPQSDSGPGTEPDTETEAQPKLKHEDEENDPHNIDDLYGDIAPRFRERPVNVRALYVGREQRPPREDDLELVFEKLARIEQKSGAAVRRPRKTLARKLAGKELKKKQESGLNYFTVDD